MPAQRAEQTLAETGAFLLGMLCPALAGYLVWKAHEQSLACPRCQGRVKRGDDPCPRCGIGLGWN